MPSFDVVSSVDIQEVRNAVLQTNKEISTRYDLKDSKSSVEFDEKASILLIDASDPMTMESITRLLAEKLAKRSVSLKSVEFGEGKAAGGDRIRKEVKIKQGLDDKELKSINKLIKDQKLKVTSSIQGDQLRVTGKKRDDLQAVIGVLKSNIADMDLQFVNFRD
ncbi:MAG: YajQ family cyclic di-GMP-binding protein [Bdellovibrionales bacterium]|nr:YajQ family cyclic di-GMP-binding protein [Bdellovibrionales bacterium]